MSTFLAIVIAVMASGYAVSDKKDERSEMGAKRPVCTIVETRPGAITTECR